MKQHSVPENIMDVEFKLFGSLTAKQFGYIIAGGLCGVLFFYIFNSLGSRLLAIIFAGLCAILGISLALIRINDQPFEVWLGNFLSAMFTSQKRVWRKEKKTPNALKNEPVKAGLPPLPQQGQIPQGGQALQIKQAVTNKQIQKPSIPQHPFKKLGDSQMNTQKDPNNEMQVQGKNLAGQGNTGQAQYVPGAVQGSVKVTTNQQPNRPIDMNAGQPVGTPPSKGVQAVGAPTINPQEPIQTPQVEMSGTKPDQPSQVEMSVSKPAEPAEQQNQVSNKATQFADILPDKSQVLPITNQSPSVSSQQLVPNDDQPIQDTMGDENKALRDKVAKEMESKQKIEKELSDARAMFKQLQKQNQDIMQQLETINAQKTPSQSAVQPTVIPTGPAPVPQPAIQKGPPIQQPTTDIKKVVAAKPEKQEDVDLFAPKIYDGPYLTKKQNVISGIVKSKDGSLLAGVVVIVKNEQDRPVRAMKTNSLGQFITTTALEKGQYTIELSKNSYGFGRYEVKLTGDVVPTYEFIAE